MVACGRPDLAASAGAGPAAASFLEAQPRPDGLEPAVEAAEALITMIMCPNFSDADSQPLRSALVLGDGLQSLKSLRHVGHRRLSDLNALADAAILELDDIAAR